MDEKMSDKKEWREFKNVIAISYEYSAGGYSCWTLNDENVNKPEYRKHLIEHAAYEAEKQRADSIADRFKSYRREMILEYKKLREQADRLEKENQKLKEALEIARNKFDYIDSVRNRNCWEDACTCAFDTAHFASKEIKEALK